ncbi:MAG: hypothetical protein PHD05_07865 [Sphaerochaetaceae bacterium]|nr:hypothetical protein [Sphaerochaetaceae bacterium]
MININWNLIATKIIGVSLILMGIYCFKYFKKIRKGQEPFTGRGIIETTKDYNKIILGCTLILLGLLLVFNP